ncbi:MAG: glutamate--tRNA ligase [Candidatus Pacebacteria bacterium]|nr:glutamate--tRNA ligase [Candidatus Paceibacterota bacterium]
MSPEEQFKFIKPGEVRTRIAPSPTGFLHVGLARTALFNYLFAKKYEGSFVLRIEDTDLERSTPEFEKDIIENLKWLGIEWDEGPDTDGKYGPYRQTQRIDLYKKYLEKLLAEDKAYYCFCSEEELEAQRQYQMSQGMAPKYSGKCANLDKETVKKYLAEGKPSVIRFRVASKKVSFNDLIRGKVEFDTGLMGDMVIAKDLNTPLYNFAVVIDDFEMKISHVIRGEDHVSNTPKQILLQEALGLTQPQYAHLPLILGTDRTKLSKRHGAVSVSEFKKQGYLPEAMINFMAFLGWNPGNEREIYSLASLVKEFSLENVQKGGAVFNVKKLDFLNGFYLRQRSPEKLTELCLPYFIEAGLVTKEKADLNFLQKIVSLYQERLKKISEIIEFTDFFFKEVLNYDKELLRWKDMEDKELKDVIDKLEKILSKIKEEDWNKENLENVLMPEAEKTGDRGKLLWPLRAALTGKEASAGPFEVAEILGKEKTIKRIKQAKELIK